MKTTVMLVGAWLVCTLVVLVWQALAANWACAEAVDPCRIDDLGARAATARKRIISRWVADAVVTLWLAQAQLLLTRLAPLPLFGGTGLAVAQSWKSVGPGAGIALSALPHLIATGLVSSAVCVLYVLVKPAHDRDTMHLKRWVHALLPVLQTRAMRTDHADPSFVILANCRDEARKEEAAELERQRQAHVATAYAEIRAASAKALPFVCHLRPEELRRRAVSLLQHEWLPLTRKFDLEVDIRIQEAIKQIDDLLGAMTVDEYSDQDTRPTFEAVLRVIGRIVGPEGVGALHEDEIRLPSGSRAQSRNASLSAPEVRTSE